MRGLRPSGPDTNSAGLGAPPQPRAMTAPAERTGVIRLAERRQTLKPSYPTLYRWALMAVVAIAVPGLAKDVQARAGRTFYVDFQAGDDQRDGLSPETAFKLSLIHI